MAFDTFQVTGLFPYPLKTSENQRFSDVFRRYRKSTNMKWVKLKICMILGIIFGAKDITN